LFAPSLQDAVSYDDFVSTFGNDSLKSWSVNERSIKNGDGKMSGSAIFDGQTYSYDLDFGNVDGQWRITAYQFN